MQIDLNSFIHALTVSLDYAENEVIRVARYHGKRVAVLSNLMAAKAGFDEERRYILTQAAALHDSALSEYLKEEFSDGAPVLEEKNMSGHCLAGERMMMKLPLYRKTEGAVLYHHERADGSGAFGKTAEETPLHAQILHMADIVDVTFNIDEMDEQKYELLQEWLTQEEGTAFSCEVCSLFREAVDYELLCSIRGEGSRRILESMQPDFMDEVSTDVLREMASFFATITDYKSHFTWRHSIGIAEKAERMGNFYGYSPELCDKLYIAGALHDLGKMLISNDILEKPGKLTISEYREIQNHALGTWELLRDIRGMEDICRWAALHHEKLDGSGYPFGYIGDELSKVERMMACLDIYQALVEERPYKRSMTHREAMDILNMMGESGQLDTTILRDIDDCFAEYSDAEENREGPEEDAVFAGEAWKCPVCGYVYEGHLPNDYICPHCEQPGSIFVQINR